MNISKTVCKALCHIDLRKEALCSRKSSSLIREQKAKAGIPVCLDNTLPSIGTGIAILLPGKHDFHVTQSNYST